MNFDRECKYITLEDELLPCCPDCQALDIDLQYGDHGYICNECGASFIVP